MSNYRLRSCVCLTLPFAFWLLPYMAFADEAKLIDVDVCVYAATPSGIQAAVSAHREGRSVVIVEPSRWVGGILGAGIKPRQDCPNIAVVGGSTRKLLDSLGGANKGKADREISPADVRADFLALLKREKIRVIYDHRISRCKKDRARITSAWFDLAPYDAVGCPPEAPTAADQLKVKAGIFIDASYEGDLLARAGMSFRIGRESTADWNEPHAGVQRPLELTPIDPFITPGHPESGHLPLVEVDHGKAVGAGDQYTQTYNFRIYVTSDPKHRAPIDKPPGYDPKDYELVGRYVEYLAKTGAGDEALSWIFPGTPNAGEYNYRRKTLISNAPLGVSHVLAGGDYATKARVWKQHQDYLRGVHYFLSTDPRVPKAFREKTAALGLDRRHHPDTGGWPHQLYIRAARRMLGEYTITEHDVYGRAKIDDPIGLAQYGIDTYPSRRIWLEHEGKIHVANEGWMFVGLGLGPTRKPYPVPYRAITPQRHECTNLIVPVCLSATHLGYASARMEPSFMINGESARLAAALAVQQDIPVQDIDQKVFRKKLLNRDQILAWPIASQ